MPQKETTQIVKQYGAQLRKFIRSRIAQVEDADDVLQDVWFQLSKFGELCSLENAGAWLYKVARNRITDHYRKKTDDALEDHTQEDEEGVREIKEILLLDESRNPELALFKNIFWKELMTALDELPENQKQVFVLNEIEGRTLQEIADLQKENIKTIISRKGYAMKHLRKRLEKLYNDLK